MPNLTICRVQVRIITDVIGAIPPNGAVHPEAARQGGMPSLEVERRNERHRASVMALARPGINAPVTSSAGRLFER